MSNNKLRYLALLSLLALLGLFTENTGFYGFLGFLGFLGFGRIIPDERFQDNVNRAGKNAFFSAMIIFPIASIIVTFTHNTMVYAFAFAISFAVQMLVFSISLSLYER